MLVVGDAEKDAKTLLREINPPYPLSPCDVFQTFAVVFGEEGKGLLLGGETSEPTEEVTLIFIRQKDFHQRSAFLKKLPTT